MTEHIHEPPDIVVALIHEHIRLIQLAAQHLPSSEELAQFLTLLERLTLLAIQIAAIV